MKEVFTNRSVIFYCILAFIAFLVLRHHDSYISPDNLDYWEGIWVEAHGMFMDIIVLGLFLAIYDFYRDKKELEQRVEREQKEQSLRFEKDRADKIDRYLEEIDDLRGWQSQEAVFRIVGNLRRLNRLNVTKINLDECYLKNARLAGINLKGSSFRYTNLENADLEDATLNNTKWSFSNFKGTVFRKAEINSSFIEDIENAAKADFGQAKFNNTHFIAFNGSGARFWSSNFKNATLSGASFKSCNMLRAIFSNCYLPQVNFENAEIFQYQESIMKTCGADTGKMNIKENPSDFETNKDAYLTNN